MAFPTSQGLLAEWEQLYIDDRQQLFWAFHSHLSSHVVLFHERMATVDGQVVDKASRDR